MTAIPARIIVSGLELFILAIARIRNEESRVKKKALPAIRYRVQKPAPETIAVTAPNPALEAIPKV